MTKTATNLERLAEMTLAQFNAPIDRCSLEQLEHAIRCLIKEDLYFEKEDLEPLDSEEAYYGLLDF